VQRHPVIYLVILHGDTELILKPERLSPDDPSEPEAVVGVHRLGLCGHVQDVLVFVQRTHTLTCVKHTEWMLTRRDVYIYVTRDLSV